MTGKRGGTGAAATTTEGKLFKSNLQKGGDMRDKTVREGEEECGFKSGIRFYIGVGSRKLTRQRRDLGDEDDGGNDSIQLIANNGSFLLSY